MGNVGYTVGKIAVKVALHTVLPGAGIVVDIIEATHEASEGNYMSASATLAFGVVDLISLGTAGAVKDAAKEAGKKAAIDSAKQTAKSTTKQIGNTAAKKIAMGGPKRAISEGAKIAAKTARKDIGRSLGKEIRKGMISDLTDEAFKKSAKKAALQGAGMGFVGSGGKSVMSEMFEEATYNFLSEMSTKTSREVFQSSTASAAKEAITPIAAEYLKTELKQDFVKSSVKGTLKRMYGKQDQ